MTDFEKEAVKYLESVFERVTKGEKVDAFEVVRYIRSKYYEAVMNELLKLIKVDDIIEADSESKPEEFTIIVDENGKLAGYVIPNTLVSRLPLEKELRQLFSVLNFVSGIKVVNKAWQFSKNVLNLNIDDREMIEDRW